MALTGPGRPSIADQRVCVNCVMDGVGSAADTGCATASAIVKHRAEHRLLTRAACPIYHLAARPPCAASADPCSAQLFNRGRRTSRTLASDRGRLSGIDAALAVDAGESDLAWARLVLTHRTRVCDRILCADRLV